MGWKRRPRHLFDWELTFKLSLVILAFAVLGFLVFG
jgi:hypothetical protein